MVDLEKLQKKIEKIVRECGDILVHADRSVLGIDEKAGRANFVTAYDKKIQEILRRELMALLPEAVFVGEESEINPSIREGYAFIVDPIDGTLNFMRNRKSSAISVGLTKDGEPVLGVIFNPDLDLMYTAIKGKGAYRNGEQIHVSELPLEDGLVMMGSASYYEELYDQTFAVAFDLFKKAMDIRRFGSAAIDCCMIAEGTAELFYELRLYPWDVAAGMLLVQEAGGVVTTFEGDKITLEGPFSILATNRVVREEL